MSEKSVNLGAVASGWWHSELSPTTGAGRMARAMLRRCDTAAEALALGPTHQLHAALCAAGRDLARDPDRLALVAVILANVKADHELDAARRFGQGGDSARLSAMRFQALIRASTPAELIRPLRRALAQIDHQASVARLANDLLHWSERVRTDWCFKYYGATTAPVIDNPEEKTA